MPAVRLGLLAIFASVTDVARPASSCPPHIPQSFSALPYLRPNLTHGAANLLAVMLDALDITEEEALGLAELARQDLALARDFARRALAAEDNDEANRLARSYQRAARSYRQTLAVKARLKRDLAAAAHVQAQTPRPKPGGVAIAKRREELRTALLRLAWDEAERPEIEPDETNAETHADDLAWFIETREKICRTLATAGARPDFMDEAVDDQAARLAMEVHLDTGDIARWRELPDPPQAVLDAEPEYDGPAWRSSA